MCSFVFNRAISPLGFFCGFFCVCFFCCTTLCSFLTVTSSFLQGLQITGKQRISAWDLMEGYKNPSPLSWAWFGAVRIERKPLKYEEDFRRLLHHTHPRRRPLSYFLTPAPDKEDEHDEEEDRREADTAAGEKASQPSTPQTPGTDVLLIALQNTYTRMIHTQQGCFWSRYW